MDEPYDQKYRRVIDQLPFMTEVVRREFDPRQVVKLAEGVHRITAPNPGVMTGPGTNTFIVGSRELTVIDPGPAMDAHIDRIADFCGDRLQQILLTHTHPDHSPGAARLHRLTGAPVMGSPVQTATVYDSSVALNHPLVGGDRLVVSGEYSLQVIATPGHVVNHLCYLLENPCWLFAGDMVMDGSTVVIAPPDGDMEAYISSLVELQGIKIDAIAPAHGRLIGDCAAYLAGLVEHRMMREQKVVAGLQKLSSASLTELLPVAYDDVPEVLHQVAALSLEAHLLKLEKDGGVSRIAGSPDVWSVRNT
ncbi:MAG TPA: MBL fold metallo-hydrolase [Gammaproteobacteria bacterium]|nr:MBL fold metallo-hydrolase [Gammaproteobacteria bacterium]